VGCGGIKFFSLNVIPEISSRGSRAKKHGFPPTIRGNDKKGQPCPELGRRVASLYQDKEDRNNVNTNEGEAYENPVLELLDICGNDKRGCKLPTILVKMIIATDPYASRAF
jgi:hypothetical protein